MSQALYRKWRPQSWEAVIGQQHVIQTLRNALAAGRIGHAYLFSGPRGTGKTTTARLLAKAVNCLEADLSRRPCGQCDHCLAVNAGRFLDLIEIDAASNTSVDDVRDLRDKIGFSPNQGRYKVYIIDEVHMLSTAAFNALLKTLEEPPSHAIFILATTEVHKIPATVLSRCQRHEFRRIPVADMTRALKALAEPEGIQIDDEALKLIARQSTGAMRDAISLLDQLASTGEVITLEMAQNLLGTATSSAVLELVQRLVERDVKVGLDAIHSALDSGGDPRQFARQIVDYLRDLLLIKTGNPQQIDATQETRALMAQHAQSFTASELLRLIRLFNFAANDARQGWQPALPLEMAFVEALEPAQAETLPVSAVQAAPRPAGPGRSTPARSTNTAPTAQAGIPAPTGLTAETAPEAPVGEARAGAASQPDQATSGSLTMQVMNDRWRQVTNLVRQRSPNTQALLNSGRLLAVRGFTVYFGLSDVLRAKMEKDDNLQVVQEALRQVFGQELTFTCVTDTGKRNAVPPDVDSDGMVAAALRDLGGEIVDIQ